VPTSYSAACHRPCRHPPSVTCGPAFWTQPLPREAKRWRQPLDTVGFRAFTLGGPTWETTQAPTASRVSFATWIHWWSSVASRCWPALALRLQRLVRDQPGQDQPFCRCNLVVDVGRVRQVLLRIAADIEELEGTTSAAGRSSASDGERMLIRAWDGETRPSSVGELRPHFPDSPGAQMDLGPRALNSALLVVL
jgi:hypothetical protein